VILKQRETLIKKSMHGSPLHSVLRLTTHIFFRNTLPNTETVNGSDEINYLDDIQGVETDHTLALMPVELRDLRLMDDYLKLPRVNLK
jgi:hypothetical protein